MARINLLAFAVNSVRSIPIRLSIFASASVIGIRVLRLPVKTGQPFHWQPMVSGSKMSFWLSKVLHEALLNRRVWCCIWMWKNMFFIHWKPFNAFNEEVWKYTLQKTLGLIQRSNLGFPMPLHFQSLMLLLMMIFSILAGGLSDWACAQPLTQRVFTRIELTGWYLQTTERVWLHMTHGPQDRISPATSIWQQAVQVFLCRQHFY